MSGDDGFVRPPTAQEAVLAELRTRIGHGRLRPGSPIRQDAIAAELGVSRVPIREALKMLEGEGHVSYRPHRGYFVTELDLDDLIEIYRIREILEDEAVRAAVPRLEPEAFERMLDAIHDMERAAGTANIIELTAANRRFHFATFEAAGLPRLQHFIRLLWDSSDPYRSLYFIDEHHRDTVNSEHRALLEALSDGDAAEAVAVLREHRLHAIAGLRGVLATDDEDGRPA